MKDSGGTNSGESRTFGCGRFVPRLFSVRNMFFSECGAGLLPALVAWFEIGSGLL
jgi:hypothetical protein